MRVSAKADYALRAAIVIASVHPDPIKRDEIVKEEKIPSKFLEAILTELRRNRLIQSQRGPEGGHRLARSPSEISAADIVRAVDGPLASVHGEAPEELSYRDRSEKLQVMWVALRTSIRTVLEGVTLADLATGELPQHIVELTTSPDDWLSH